VRPQLLRAPPASHHPAAARAAPRPRRDLLSRGILLRSETWAEPDLSRIVAREAILVPPSGRASCQAGEDAMRFFARFGRNS